jgi:lipoprotein-anchoring transpeptidase ErfK/SrfK
MVSGEQLLAVERSVPAGDDRSIEAVRALLHGVTNQEQAQSIDTAIPPGTALESAAVRERTAILVFNDRLVAGASGASLPDGAETDYYARLAQVTFTATAVDGVDRVEVSVPGKQTLYLTRQDFSGPASAASPAPTPTLSAYAASDRPASGGTASSIATTSPSASASLHAQTTSPAPAASTEATSSATPSPTASTRAAGRSRIDPKDAKAVQTKLVRLRYLPWKAVTGVFDDRTAQAVMAFQSWEGLMRDGVVGKQTTGRLVAGKGRWIEVHRDKATVLVVQAGRTVRAVHTSTGQTGDDPPYDTPAGSFAIYAKQLKSWSVPYKVWMPYAMYFNGDIAMHGSDSVPPYPASHGCVRLPQVEAPVVYGMASEGTPVYVF